MKLAVDKIKNRIFVSGAVRSGTTFTGRVLSLPLEVDYLHEPYNQLRYSFGKNYARPYVRLNIDTPQMQAYHAFTKNIFSYDIKLPNYIPKQDSLFKKVSKKILGSRGPFYLRIAKINPFHKAMVIKDPVALFMTEYLYVHFQVKPVILVKHPISFVVSLQRKNWSHSPREFINHNDLIEDFFFDEPDYLERKWNTSIEAAAAYWRVIYKVLLIQSQKYQDWQIVKHEAICQDPILVFNQLYSFLDLPWSGSIERKIIAMTEGNGTNKGKLSRLHSLRRNSSEIFEASLQSLTIKERKAIFEIVKDVALPVYSRETFLID